ncbi:uncharacterized protein A1O5_02062 [Cladophialophora psammophila CBS 110553]|uniref:Metallo-beta-lactamase domain-containing protein n=1 Tax=Cladophialophora psammophila CBS 110553 TaxID=1182543 RepID=W9XEM0_9EURO|nr:uncharacterized protein A1O5_02062 [Cladophialophora psammophila CBS 110553]EXJ75366.1 hypothetical protein A1O5_02062 [Cladophialophora psammophila CBS 110553]
MATSISVTSTHLCLATGISIIVELSFSDTLQIGQFKAYDFFGDGSFYLLDVPGHAVGYMAGLVRTTQDTFVLFGADICHFASSIRPSSAPLVYQEPFTHISTDAATFYKDPPVAEKSVLGLMEFDADPCILVTIAHDPAALDVYDFFPRGNLNDWQQKGWKEAARWGFLSELPYNGKTVRPVPVDRLYKQGQKVDAWSYLRHNPCGFGKVWKRAYFIHQTPTAESQFPC